MPAHAAAQALRVITAPAGGVVRRRARRRASASAAPCGSRLPCGCVALSAEGVDTPSQRRYVHQVGALLQAQGAYFATPLSTGAGSPGGSLKERARPVALPLRPTLVLHELVASFAAI